VDEQIITTLKAFGRLTTRELATKIGAARESVYHWCRRLEREGRLVSELKQAGRKSVFFFPMTREIVTTESHPGIAQLDQAVRTIICSFQLPHEREKLVAGLEVGLERIAETVPEHRRGFFEEFAEQLLAIASKAQKRGDLTSQLGIRPLHPPTRVWMLGPQLSLL